MSIKIINKCFFNLLTILTVAYDLLSIQAYYGGFVLNFNVSQSFDNRIVVTNRWFKSVSRGDYIIFDHPLFDLALCKQVVGIEGDEIKVIKDKIYVNNIFRGVALTNSLHSKKPLESIKARIVPKDYFYVFAPHPHSFDSRYQAVGLVHKSRIKGRAWLL